MAKKGICAAVAMALARNLVLLRNQISRSQPVRGPPLHWHAEFLASGMVLALAHLPREGPTALDSPTPRKVGTATAREANGVGLSDATEVSAETGLGVFSGLGASSPRVLVFAAFLGSGDASFFCDFFLAVFSLGVGLPDFFRFCDATDGSGVSLGLRFGLASSSADSFARFDLRGG